MAASDITHWKFGTVKRLSWDWLSGASGEAYSQATATRINGIIDRVEFVPDGGDTAPTTLYDVVLNSANGIDVLEGAGADLSATVASSNSDLSIGVNDILTLVVSNAGNANGGIVTVYYI
jgi:hypothetical protein